jgi:hypothetical protein
MSWSYAIAAVLPGWTLLLGLALGFGADFVLEAVHG